MSAQPSLSPDPRVFAPYSLDILVSGAARLRPETVAFADRTTTCPFGIVAARVAALARLFADYGLRPGECLLLAGGAEVSLVIGLIAALRGGFEPALAPLDLNEAELAAYAGAVNAAALIGPTAYGELDPIEAYFATAATAPSVRLLATLGPGEVDGAVDLSAACVLRYAATHPDDGLERGKPAPAPPRITTFDRARLKPVRHEQTTLMAAGLDFVARAKIGRGTPILSTLPPTSFAGLAAGPFAALLSGATLYLHGPFAADDFLKTRDRAGHAHLVVPAAIAPDLAGAAILPGLASMVPVSRLSSDAGFTSPPSFASPCPVVDLYAIDEAAAVPEPRRGARPAQPASEPHFVGTRGSPRPDHRAGGRSCIRLSRRGGHATERRRVMFLLAFLVAVLLIVLMTSMRVANQYERAVVFRLGRYARTAGPGLYLLLPFIEWQVKVDLRTTTTQVEPQETITRDNVPVKINAVIWRRIVDPQLAVIEVTDVGNSVVQVAVTALRNVIGQHSLDEVLKEQVAVTEALQSMIDTVTGPWGVKARSPCRSCFSAALRLPQLAPSGLHRANAGR